MEWKEFFKPNWKKLILFIILVMSERLVNTFVLGYYLVYGAKLSSIIILSPFDVFNRLMIPILVTADKTPIIQLSFDTLIGVLTQLLNLLWQYFLACSIIFVCNNFRKKFKTTKTKNMEK